LSKTIVTHYSPDFDGIPAIWLLKKFHPDFKNAKIAFAPAGETYNNEPVDSKEDIVHVDTGMGKFDHHQTNDFTCGAQLVYEWLVKEGYVKDDEALGRLVKILTEIDHAWDVYKWCEPESDRYEFSLHNILVGWKILYPRQDEKYVEWTIFALEAVYKLLQNKVAAEKDVERGKKFKTRWGEGIAVYTQNDTVLDVAMKSGYALVVRKDPGKGYVRVTGSNKHNVDLSKALELAVKADPDATWFLHASKVLLRNGSTRNPTMKPTKLDIDQIVEILKKA
jgi:hypothetical protein